MKEQIWRIRNDVGDYLDQIFPFLGVRFIAVNENYDSRSSIGSPVSLDVSLKAMVYEMYSRDISEKIRCFCVCGNRVYCVWKFANN